MDLRVLRYFLAVAREESISRAAQAVHITQPSLSRQIMDLERELKTKLFERGRKKRRLMLTPAGALLRKRAEELVLLADKTKTEFLSQDNQISGDVYLGGGETDGMRLAARAVRQMQREHPLVRYHLFSGNAEDVTERLDKGLLDFAVLIGAAKLERYDYITLPVQDRWGLLLPKNHPLAAQKNIRATDLAGVPLLVDNAHGSHLGAFGRHPLQLGAAMTADSAHKTLPVLTGGAYWHMGKEAAQQLTRRQAKAAMLVIVAAVTDMVPGQLHVLDTMDGQGTGMFDFEPLLTQLAAQHIQGIVHGGHAYGDEAVDSRLRLAHGFVADPADGLAAGGLDEALDGVRKGCVIDAPLDVEGKIVLILEVRIRHVHGQALDGPVHTLQGLFRQDASRHAAAQGQKAQLLEI